MSIQTFTAANYRGRVDLHSQELWQLVGLLFGVGVLVVLAPVLRIPYPILLVLGGLALAFVPGLPEFDLRPEVVLLGFLPPLLYSSAFFTSVRDLRANLRPVSMLAIGLVAATMASVAVVAHWLVDDLTWPAAFVLGAVVSPTDPIAATSIGRRLGVPRRLVTVIESESLLNDASALVFYRTAVVATVVGTFSVWEAGAQLVINAVGGIAIGLVVGYVVRQVRKRLDDSPTEITVALFTAYLAYLPAEALGVSAVLAAVTVGLYMGWYTPELTNAETRVQGEAFWTILTFILNAALFVLVGLQIPHVLDQLDGWSTSELALSAAGVCASVILIRLAFVFPLAYVPRFLIRKIRERDPYPTWRIPLVLGWSGMRGAVSLAAALAIPLTIDGGDPFPGRDIIIFLASSVILATLVLQGLTLPLLIRLVGLEDDGAAAIEEAKARIRAAEGALARLEELVEAGEIREDTAERIRGLYNFRADRFRERLDDDRSEIEERSQAFQQVRRELLRAEEQAVLELRRAGVISDDVMHRILRDLALEELRLDFGA
jgi:monovalent cation/hydrogen antiporter